HRSSQPSLHLRRRQGNFGERARVRQGPLAVDGRRAMGEGAAHVLQGQSVLGLTMLRARGGRCRPLRRGAHAEVRTCLTTAPAFSAGPERISARLASKTGANASRPFCTAPMCQRKPRAAYALAALRIEEEKLDDSQAQERTVPAVLAQDKSSDRQAAKPRDLRVARGRGEAR